MTCNDVFSVDRHVEKESLADYINKKREMFLVQVRDIFVTLNFLLWLKWLLKFAFFSVFTRCEAGRDAEVGGDCGCRGEEAGDGRAISGRGCRHV